ncbi:phage distal tail protein [Streptosporangium sp. CA-115845]|uniref:phage distal tail protein n=1 Tax=Streptosporangium sp. CA-115845 TaxID=3240071 RepID=UPI003D92070E
MADLSDYQLDWNGFLLGAGTVYELVQLDGWIDSPGLTNGAAPRSTRHGSWPGGMRGQARTVTATLEIVADGAGMGPAIRALRAATPIVRSAAQGSLAICCDGETLVAAAKFAGRIVPVDQPYSMGYVPQATVQWYCADPRLYEPAEQSVTIGAPTGGSGGLVYPLAYPLVYGTAPVPNTATCINTGNAETNPLVTFTGPLTVPRLVNGTLGWALIFDIDLPAGQTLIVDTDRGTALLNGTTDRLDTRSNLGVPVEYFELAPGPNDLSLLAEAFGEGAQVTVRWKSASM